MNDSSKQTVKRIATGAALVALPVAGFKLYQKAQDAAATRDRALEKGITYDIAALREVDPALVKYQRAGKIDVGLAAPRAIALDKAGNLYVAGERTVRRFTPAGAPLADIKLSAPVYAVAAADDGAIYVALKDRVEVFAPDGSKKASWPALHADSYITGLAVSSDAVFIADSGRRVVVRTDLSGKVLGEIGRTDASRGIPGLLLPSPHLDVALAADGTVWTNNTGRHRLENYQLDGTLSRFWGEQGTAIQAFPGCCNPTDFTILPDGSFITAEKGLARVKRYLADGRFDCVIAAPQSFGDNMLGLDVAADAQGRILVLERGTSVVHVFVKKQGGAI